MILLLLAVQLAFGPLAIGQKAFEPLAFGQKPTHLRADLIRLGREAGGRVPKVNSRFPLLSWSVHAGMQTGYQILLGTDKGMLLKDSADWWNSGRVGVGESIANRYHGRALEPSRVYYWKVRTWSGRVAGPYSDIRAFATGDTLADFALPSFELRRELEMPVAMRVLNGDRVVYDFGKDGFGQLDVRVGRGHGMDTLTIALGEGLAADGSVNRKPPGTVRFREVRLPLVPGVTAYHVRVAPDDRNTGPKAIRMPADIGEVLPFRYVEIAGGSGFSKGSGPSGGSGFSVGSGFSEGTGGSGASGDVKVSRQLVTADFDDSAVSFVSSDTALNRIWELCKYTVKATSFTGFYVDGDRERIPYEADALITQLSHYSTDAEFNMAKRSLNYLIFHPTWPTEWSLQNVLIAWNDYLYSGDDRLVRRLYPDLKNKLLAGLAREDGLISTRTGKQTPELLESIHYQVFNTSKQLEDIVDWPHQSIQPSGETDGFVFMDYNSVVNAFYYEDLKVMHQLSLALGFGGDAARYQAMAEVVRRSFVHTFIDKASGLVVDGEGTKHSSLHANMFALAFGLVPAVNVSKVVSFIQSRGMACSVYGAQWLLDGLSEAGDADYALGLITSHSDRSWFNMLREGATMTMEAWGQKYKPNQDWNHAWGTAPANYIVRDLMGVRPLAAGFRTVMIRPRPGKLEHASLNYLTVRGPLRVSFNNRAGRFEMTVALPGNTTGEVYLPFGLVEVHVRMDGRDVKAVRAGSYWRVAGVGPGVHSFDQF